MRASTAIWLIVGLIAVAGLVKVLSIPADPGGPHAASSARGAKTPEPESADTTAQPVSARGVLHDVVASSLRLRAGPSVGSAIHGIALRGDRVTVLARQGAWLDVRLQDGTRGWMYGTHLTPSVVTPNPTLEPMLAAVSPTRSVFIDAVGRATVTDGDTIRIGDVRIRLQGIDAPESGQSCEDAQGRLYPCGGRAANALDALVGRRPVACRRDDTDRYGRMVGTCEMLETGDSLNASMVRSGWALAYRRYSAAYVAQEAAAKAEGRGLWQGRFIEPWAYRAGARLKRSRSDNGGGAPQSAKRSRTATAGTTAGSCTIKGNISGSRRIYHMPGSLWYERTRIDTRRGERWFCSESEARAAGWRAARG